jgi:hypothetical protein
MNAPRKLRARRAYFGWGGAAWTLPIPTGPRIQLDSLMYFGTKWQSVEIVRTGEIIDIRRIGNEFAEVRR